MKTLTNEQLTIQVDAHGAELCSIRCNGTEYLWQADPAYWNRHSPVLFPIVGRVWENRYRVGEQEYNLSQHGFARDMKFTLIKETDTELRYRLTDTEATRANYPYAFVLEIGYRISGRRVEVMWQVSNPSSDQELCFQIGAHPAFYYPDYNPDTKERGYFSFDTDAPLVSSRLAEKGCLSPTEKMPIDLAEGFLPITTDTFGIDTIILENHQVHQVTLHGLDKQPRLKVTFPMPVVALWSPPGKNAPFVCIEPWYGRCDRAHYEGSFCDKDWMNRLAPGDVFDGGYAIEIL